MYIIIWIYILLITIIWSQLLYLHIFAFLVNTARWYASRWWQRCIYASSTGRNSEYIAVDGSHLIAVAQSKPFSKSQMFATNAVCRFTWVHPNIVRPNNFFPWFIVKRLSETEAVHQKNISCTELAQQVVTLLQLQLEVQRCSDISCHFKSVIENLHI